MKLWSSRDSQELCSTVHTQRWLAFDLVVISKMQNFFLEEAGGRESIKSEAALLLLRSQYAKRYLPLLRLVILWTAEVCMLWIIRGHLQRSMQTRRFSILSMLFLCFSRKNRTSIFLTFNYNVESIFNSTGFGDFFVPKLKQSFDLSK